MSCAARPLCRSSAREAEDLADAGDVATLIVFDDPPLFKGGKAPQGEDVSNLNETLDWMSDERFFGDGGTVLTQAALARHREGRKMIADPQPSTTNGMQHLMHLQKGCDREMCQGLQQVGDTPDGSSTVGQGSLEASSPKLVEGNGFSATATEGSELRAVEPDDAQYSGPVSVSNMYSALLGCSDQEMPGEKSDDVPDIALQHGLRCQQETVIVTQGGAASIIQQQVRKAAKAQPASRPELCKRDSSSKKLSRSSSTSQRRPSGGSSIPAFADVGTSCFSPESSGSLPRPARQMPEASASSDVEQATSSPREAVALPTAARNSAAGLNRTKSGLNTRPGTSVTSSGGAASRSSTPRSSTPRSSSPRSSTPTPSSTTPRSSTTCGSSLLDLNDTQGLNSSEHSSEPFNPGVAKRRFLTRGASMDSLASTAASSAASSDDSPGLPFSRWSKARGLIRGLAGFQAPAGAHNDPGNAVMIFDWDDTLCPTWWASSASGLDDTTVRLDVELHREELRQHSAAVEAILRTARSVARVGVVTLAKREWLNASFKRLFPDLDVEALFEELGIQVYCAVLNRSARNSSPTQAPILAKKKAMSKCLQNLYRSRSSQLRWNVTSVGDSSIEQHALKELLKENSRGTVCKTVKFAADPTLQQLTCQLETLTPHIPRIVSYPKDFDWTSTTLFLGQ